MATTISSADLATRLRPATLLLFVFGVAEAQISTPPRVTAEYVNAVGFGLSYGEMLEREADFWGWSANYSRLLNDAWAAGLALTWDKETEQVADRPDRTVRTYALVATISYTLTPSVSLTTGLAKNIADDDNATRTTKFKLGDVSTGVALGYTLALNKRNSFNASLAYEYNLSRNDPDISVDISLGRSF